VEPQPKSNLVHFGLKIGHLVATIFPENQLTKSSRSLNSKGKSGPGADPVGSGGEAPRSWRENHA